MAKADTPADFLRKASPICKDRIGLSKFVYTKSNQKSIATCLVNTSHPDFSINPNKIMEGVGCPECAGNKKKDLATILQEVQEVHGDKYSLTENSIYLGTNSKLELFCNECKVPFLISPKKCKYGQGHRDCSRARAEAGRTQTFAEFVKRSEEVFGKEVFTYYKETYRNFNSITKIGCRIHGDFEVKPVDFVSSTYGCPECSVMGRARTQQKEFAECFVDNANVAHRNKYDYSEFIFVNYNTKGIIHCPVKAHGSFMMSPYAHLSTLSGCPKCAPTFSKAQQEVAEYVSSLGVEIECDVKLPSGLEVDILIRSKNIAIEYNGLRWHSDQFRPPTFHLRKTLECQSVGLRLVHIYEDEWLYKKEIVKVLLTVILGKCETKKSARKCEIKSVSWEDYKNFNNLHHLQGVGTAPSIRLGLWYGNTLVSVMGFSNRESSSGEIELVRFSSNGIVRGAFSKLLKHSKKYLPNSVTKIVSFSDLRWSVGSVYLANGFNCISRSKPTYWYVVKSKREDKRGYQRKYLPYKLKVFDPNLSEVENCRANGLYRIFDCGKDRWELLL